MEVSQRLSEAAENLATLKRAGYFQQLMDTLGWVDLMQLRRSWVDDALRVVRAMPTADAVVLADAVRRWQLAADLLELERNYIRDTIDAAKEIPGSLTVEDALLMEKIQNEQSESPASQPGTVSTGGF